MHAAASGWKAVLDLLAAASLVFFSGIDGDTPLHTARVVKILTAVLRWNQASFINHKRNDTTTVKIITSP
jgi:hypothetical protein